jgi:hypothetical protein
MAMDLLYISGVLFPAIPLAMVAIGARYTAVAGIIRSLHMQITGATPASGPAEVLAAELKSLRLRIELVKFSQFFAAVSFVLNLVPVLLFAHGAEVKGLFSYSGSAVTLTLAMLLFMAEIFFSTRALNLHISGMRAHG